MKVFVFNLLLHLTNLIISVHCTIVIQDLRCENVSSLAWLWNLRNNNRCLYITSSYIIPKCFFDQLINTKFVARIISSKLLLYQNIYNSTRTNCDNFLIFSNDKNYVTELFVQKENEKRFSPFSQIYLVVPDMEFERNAIEYVNQNALNVFLMENTLDEMEKGLITFKSMSNILTRKRYTLSATSVRADAAKYYGNYKDHPLLSTKSKEKVFRVSLFNCPPYVVYVPGHRFDGLEYRILLEITKPWTIKHTKCDISPTIKDPWSTVLRNVNNDTSDLAMCSVWLNVKSDTYYDVTNHVDYQCGTFLVPKPKLVNPAAYLYMSLSRNVWFAFLLSFVLVSVILTVTARAGLRTLKRTWKDDSYSDLTRSFLDSLNVATAHGIERFPRQDSMKTLLTSWILLCLLIGVGYNTGYTSLLTHPISTKPVDDLVQFLDQGIYWTVGIGGPNVLASTLNATGVPKFVQLSQRTFNKTNTDGTFNDKNALFVKIITNRFITDITNMTDPRHSLRVMKSCFLNYYSVVALKKYSCYTRYFNEKIRSYREFGLTRYWALNIKGANNNYMKPYFRKNDKINKGPTRLTVKTLTGAFYLLIAGLSSAFVTFLIECLFAVFYLNKNRFKVISMCM